MENIFIEEVPTKLTKDETRLLFLAYQKGSTTAKDKLILHNIKLVLYEVRKRFLYTGHDLKDLVSVGNLGLLKAVETFKIEKGYEFTTYAIRCIDFEILAYLRNNKKHQGIESIEEVIYTDSEDSKVTLESILKSDYETKELIEMLDNLIETFPYNEKEMLKMAFGFYNDYIYTHQQIADFLGLSKGQVTRTINKSLQKLKGILEHNNSPKRTK